ncbi:hypothetical protein LK10_05450 [Sinomonas humi]|uniref:Uncharacterized protein n=1 Tax=Sinomonas humi TaxID=1338436 RepID=A0A0B2AM69_9MICC|nr:hypothetical protein LK10_05450 [Sinomonas humi]
MGVDAASGLERPPRRTEYWRNITYGSSRLSRSRLSRAHGTDRPRQSGQRSAWSDGFPSRCNVLRRILRLPLASDIAVHRAGAR